MKYTWQLYLIIFFSVGIFSLLSLRTVAADYVPNIRGLASSSQGYISFNCLDDDFFGRFTHTFAFYFNVPPCSVSSHGVNLKANNNLSGSAWSPSLGYIYFDSESTPPLPLEKYSFNQFCAPGDHCTSANKCIACYNPDHEKIYGFAYRDAQGGEWIRLDENISQPVKMTNQNAGRPGVFSGFASPPTSSNIGPISFNCISDDTCNINDYKVYMWKLAVYEMSAPNWSFTQACTGANRVIFRWKLRSGQQSAYRLIISKENSTSSPTAINSGIIYSGATQVSCPGDIGCGGFVPTYDTSYYWWLQLFDEDNQPTEWYQFDTDSLGLEDPDNGAYNSVKNQVNPNLTFTTYRHIFPSPFFDYQPKEIIINDPVSFVSEAKFYSDEQPYSQQDCVDGKCYYLWTTSRPQDSIISSSTSASTDITFTSIRNQSVTLQVNDNAGYMCSYTVPLNQINFKLPLWKEIKAR